MKLHRKGRYRLLVTAVLLGTVCSFVPENLRSGSVRIPRKNANAGSVPGTHTVSKQPSASATRHKVSQTSIDANALPIKNDLIQGPVSANKSIGSITFLLPSSGADEIKTNFGSSSPVGNPSLDEAVRHLANKSQYFSDGRVETRIVYVPIEEQDESVWKDLLETDVLLAMGLQYEADLAFARKLFQQRHDRDAEHRFRQCHFAIDCAQSFPTMVGPYDSENPSFRAKLLPWTKHASGKRLSQQMVALLQRGNSDDFVFAIMLFLNQFSGSSVDWVKHSIDATWEKGPLRNAQEVVSMVSKCGDCVIKCVQDDNCRECLEVLTALDTRDQVASYRTIVSYESDLLKDFSFCILQKNNIFNCDASLPTLPNVQPVATWREQPLTEDIARSLLVGHLNDEAAPESSLRTDISWKVACGANEAYDKFPSQNQLFYPAARGRDLWYDPVFRVETLDGRNVWCKRHYKVRPADIPGTFRFSVLDNGITSNEFWTIVGVADDLSWIVFHYAGAASAVGQRYLGGLLCTADGSLPDESQRPEIWRVLRSAGIQPWDLYTVNNDLTSPGAQEAGPPPLDYFRREVLAKRAASSPHP